MQMMDSESNICQIAALKHGRLVLSETYHGYSKDDCCHIASATKSIAGLLVGIAVDSQETAYGTQYSGRLDVLNGVPYRISVDLAE